MQGSFPYWPNSLLDYSALLPSNSVSHHIGLTLICVPLNPHSFNHLWYHLCFLLPWVPLLLLFSSLGFSSAIFLATTTYTKEATMFFFSQPPQNKFHYTFNTPCFSAPKQVFLGSPQKTLAHQVPSPLPPLLYNRFLCSAIFLPPSSQHVLLCFSHIQPPPHTHPQQIPLCCLHLPHQPF